MKKFKDINDFKQQLQDKFNTADAIPSGRYEFEDGRAIFYNALLYEDTLQKVTKPKGFVLRGILSALATGFWLVLALSSDTPLLVYGCSVASLVSLCWGFTEVWGLHKLAKDSVK